MRLPYLPFLYLLLKSSQDSFNVSDNFNVSSIKTAIVKLTKMIEREKKNCAYLCYCNYVSNLRVSVTPVG